MSDENKLIRQREIGQRAQALKDDELLTAIFEGLKTRYMRDWVQTNPEDKQQREDKWFALHALLDVRADMNAIISDGKLALAALEANRTKVAA